MAQRLAPAEQRAMQAVIERAVRQLEPDLIDASGPLAFPGGWVFMQRRLEDLVDLARRHPGRDFGGTLDSLLDELCATCAYQLDGAACPLRTLRACGLCNHAGPMLDAIRGELSRSGSPAMDDLGHVT